jgi:glycosyltransferase involved in cell wall biosynthesis
MNWTPGYLAARRLITSIFPLVKQLVPEARLLVAGWHAREALAEFVNYPDVTIVEDVSDAESYFARLRVLAYPPPQGSGVKVKVLEAMAWGIPVVTTTAGVEGIEAVDGEHCFVTDEDDVFAQRVVELLRDGNLRRALRQRARALIEEQHSPRPVVDRLEQVYQVL